ncbi:uncharacterized protein [Primulina huaijiensis]|uniref:uncharacterized protein isoform X3 n=1 Tax=Primulina huaijiensis TaxID=1492673 RepID=UPI003CC78DD4
MLPFEASAICQKKNQKNCYEAVPGHLSMGNVVGSFSSGFAQLVNTILGRPLDFLAGKNCDTVKRRRRRRRRDIEESVETSSSTSEGGYELGKTSVLQHNRNLGRRRSSFSIRRNYKDEHLRRTLRPNNHRSRVRVARDHSLHLPRRKSFKNGECSMSPLHHHIRVTRSSRFAHKGSMHRSGIHHRRR